jgi:sulfur-oxidizing protein SoxY
VARPARPLFGLWNDDHPQSARLRRNSTVADCPRPPDTAGRTGDSIIGEAAMTCARCDLASLIVVFGLLAPLPALAGSAWDDIRPSAFGNRAIEDGARHIRFHAPYRAEDQRSVPLSVETEFADGRKVKAVTFIVDENPMPVAAAFRFADNRDRAALGIDIRLDHASPVRVVVETSDGALYMTEKFVKASGMGVCAAPPIGDPVLAAVTMGQMKLTDLTGSDAAAAATRFHRTVRLDIRHPQHTGMQMNQITLLYTPLRFVSAVEVRQGDEKLFDLEGSMTLSENPRITFDYRMNGAPEVRVHTKDTSDSVWTKDFPVGSSS